jgi:hypothetical protein
MLSREAGAHTDTAHDDVFGQTLIGETLAQSKNEVARSFGGLFSAWILNLSVRSSINALQFFVFDLFFPQ